MTYLSTLLVHRNASPRLLKLMLTDGLYLSAILMSAGGSKLRWCTSMSFATHLPLSPIAKPTLFRAGSSRRVIGMLSVSRTPLGLLLKMTTAMTTRTDCRGHHLLLDQDCVWAV